MKATERDTWIPLLMFCFGILALVLGWRLFWFLCDDAYIAFRYVSNSLSGFGYVWNPPPFRATEGYTSFLWIALLDAVWRAFHIAPPQSANYISLLFSIANLGLGSILFFSTAGAGRGSLFRYLLFGCFLGAVLTNRTFLAWTSSGLETAMFNFFIMAWVFCCLRLPQNPILWMTLASLAATMIALTRPDGLLFCGMTGVIWLIVHGREGVSKGALKRISQLLPLGAVAIHLAWRKTFYGEWVPNTYYAKYTGAWPEAGMRYLFSFVLEYGLWVWILVAAAAMTRLKSSALFRPAAPDGEEKRIAQAVTVAVVAALLLHLCYYTFVIGGDHFEYRVYSHLVPFLWISFFWMLTKLEVRPPAALAIGCAAMLLSWPLPWTHWALCRTRTTREETVMMRVPVAPHWPKMLRWYAEPFDATQNWLISHFLCVRREEHKIACEWWLRDAIPSREEGEKISGSSYPVMVAAGGIGGLGWVLPHVCFIDLYGLNDRVIARSPLRPARERLMAHDRVAPEEYVRAFRPNVTMDNKTVTVLPRDEPLTGAEIAAIEEKWKP